MNGTIATEHDADLADAQRRLWHWINAIDAACNRFDAMSEVSRLNRGDGGPVSVSSTFELVLDAAWRSFDATGGLCDPTVLPALIALGYDDDYDRIAARDDVTVSTPLPAPGLGAVHWDRDAHTVSLDEGCQVDFGASAKALCADLVATELAQRGGVIVEIGGDVAVRGRGPDGPWVIGISDSLAITGWPSKSPRQSGRTQIRIQRFFDGNTEFVFF